MLGVLRQNIEDNGGYVNDTEDGVNTVLIDVRQDKGAVQNFYHLHDDPEKRGATVEYVSFVSKIIRDGVFRHMKPPMKALGGRPPGRWRQEFTLQDDERLCRWLAYKIPNNKMGGRLGLGVYQELVNMAQAFPQEYKWAARHTVESWKQRYKTRRVGFDVRIKEIYEEEKPSKDARRPFSRQANKKMLVEEEEEEEEELEEEEEDQQERQDEEEEEEEGRGGGTISRKRRRSERSSHNQVPQSAKRQRTGQSSGQANRKGKGKAREDEEEEVVEIIEDKESSLFSGDEEIVFAYGFDEPGPSGRTRSPERTLVSHQTGPSPPSFVTQETLVNSGRPSYIDPTEHISNSRSEGTRGDDSRRLSQPQRPQQKPPSVGPSRRPASQPSPQKTNLRSPAQPVRFAAPEPSPTQVPGPSSQAIDLGRAPSRTPTPPPAAQPRPTTSQQILKKAARRPRVVASPPASAPARNTRSRSRSVEPVALPTQTRKRAARKKQIPEEIPEEEPAPPVLEEPVENITIPIRETFVDEMDVENLLMDVDPPSVVLPQASTSRRSPSMETDDAETHRDLQAAAAAAPRTSRAAPSHVPAFFRIKPSEVLREYDASRSVGVPTTSRAPSVALSRRDSSLLPRFPPNRPRQSEQVIRRGDVGFSFNTRTSADGYSLPEPRTPQKRGSVSSADSFPLPGTRASAAKKGEKQKEKGTPYRPPAGTRAALLARSD
ncbi:unnamed protein product [Cyclocybe aegerita]|uniref:Rap1 Myb domain-containing protein n=1 Tax=Cyclocybe aegerita TaxID=1973307 RepID=A0A8S0XU27_CYCAE|nr:unnamed protein product [Cyclocybe aegerita]